MYMCIPMFYKYSVCNYRIGLKILFFITSLNVKSDSMLNFNEELRMDKLVGHGFQV